MKKLFIFLVAMLLAVNSYGAVVATRITGNTVSYSTIVYGGSSITPNVITLNTATNHIILQNLSTIADCYADLRCVDSTGKTGYLTRDSACVRLPMLGSQTPNTVILDFATRNIGFCSDKVSTMGTGNLAINSNESISYIITGDWGDF